MGRGFQLILLALAFGSSEAAFCSGSPDAGERVNEFPIFDGTETMTFVRSVENGQLFYVSFGVLFCFLLPSIPPTPYFHPFFCCYTCFNFNLYIGWS
jgi:hypothetical protein